MSPPPLPEIFQHEGDEDDDSEFIEEEWEVLEDEPPPPDVRKHKFNLRFDDQRLEANFAAVHNANLARMAIAGYLLCFCSALYILFVPETTFNKAATADGVQAWRSTFGFLPAVLLLIPRTRAFYFRHRETFITFIFCTTTLWELHVKHYMNCIDDVSFRKSIYLHGYTWIGVVILMFQLRFRMLFPLALACFAADATLLPAICTRFYPATSLLTCVGFDVLRVGLFVLGGPLLVVWWMEKRCRDIFLLRMREE